MFLTLRWCLLGHRLARRCFHACFRTLVLFALQRNVGATLSGERRGLRFNKFTNKNRNRRNIHFTHQMHRGNHNKHKRNRSKHPRTHTSLISHPRLPTIPPPPNSSQEITHPYQRETHSKHVCKPPPPFPFLPQVPSCHCCPFLLWLHCSMFLFPRLCLPSPPSINY